MLSYTWESLKEWVKTKLSATSVVTNEVENYLQLYLLLLIFWWFYFTVLEAGWIKVLAFIGQIHHYHVMYHDGTVLPLTITHSSLNCMTIRIGNKSIHTQLYIVDKIILWLEVQFISDLKQCNEVLSFLIMVHGVLKNGILFWFEINWKLKLIPHFLFFLFFHGCRFLIQYSVLSTSSKSLLNTILELIFPTVQYLLNSIQNENLFL